MALIDALTAAEPDSVFAAEWAIKLTRSVELGPDAAAHQHWYGGFERVPGEAGASAAQVSFGFDHDAASGQVSRLIGVGHFVLGDAIVLKLAAANDDYGFAQVA